MKITSETETEAEQLCITLCNLVRNTIHSAYTEKDLNKAVRNLTELIDLLNSELKIYQDAMKID